MRWRTVAGKPSRTDNVVQVRIHLPQYAIGTGQVAAGGSVSFGLGGQPSPPACGSVPKHRPVTLANAGRPHLNSEWMPHTPKRSCWGSRNRKDIRVEGTRGGDSC